MYGLVFDRHESLDAPVHEMLIAHHRSCYVRPHRHSEKAESLIVVEGRATAIFFDDRGEVESSVELAAPPSPAFAYRAPPGRWHGALIRSEWLIFIEVAAGPFTAASSEFPAWAPEDGTPEAGAYMADLLRRLPG